MNTRQLLVNRSFEVHGNWYSALHKLNEYKSVELSYLYNTMSSAGDWEGYIVQKIKDKRYLILFSQENNWPRVGFTAYTSQSPIATWQGKLSCDDVCQIIDDYIEANWQ